jgi:hypothetical protein
LYVRAAALNTAANRLASAFPDATKFFNVLAPATT